MAETAQKQVVAAYIPYKTLETATEALAAAGVPRVLDRSAFPSFSGSMKGWIISAFQFLGYIDGSGNTQPLLSRWVREPEARPAIMAEILRAKYPAVVALAAENGTPSQFRAEMEKLGTSGSTSQKAIRFFVAAAEVADIRIPPTWKKMRVPLGNGKRKPKPETNGRSTTGAGTGTPVVKRPPSGSEEVVRLNGGGVVTLSIDANIMALTPEDREWLFGLIDDFKSYQSADDADDDGDADDDEDA